MKFYHFWPKNDGEKWSRENIFEIPPCAKPFSENLFITEFALLSTNLPFYEVKMTPFAHGGISIKNFVMHVHILNETLSHKFHPYSILST